MRRQNSDIDCPRKPAVENTAKSVGEYGLQIQQQFSAQQSLQYSQLNANTQPAVPKLQMKDLASSQSTREPFVTKQRTANVTSGQSNFLDIISNFSPQPFGGNMADR